MIVAISTTAMATSTFAAKTPANPSQTSTILSKIDILQNKLDSAYEANESVVSQASESMDKLTEADWKAIDAIHTAAFEKAEAFLKSKGIVLSEDNMFDDIDTSKLSTADQKTYTDFGDDAEKKIREYMISRGVKLENTSNDDIKSLEKQIDALWEQVPASQFDALLEDDTPKK